MKNTLETRLGIFFALALVVAFLVMEMVGSFDFLKSGTRVSSMFNNVQELNEGDPVKLGGKQIGRVETIRLKENRVEVIMKLADANAVRTDSEATIRFSGLLGQNFIALSFGSPTAPRVENNTLLQSREQPDLGSLMSKLENVATGIENVTRSFSGEQIQKLLAPMADFVKENSPRLAAILGNLQTVTTRIADREGTFGRMLGDDALYNAALGTVTNFNATALDLQAALQDVRGLLDRVEHGDGTLAKLAHDGALYTEATSALTHLREILQKINQGQGTIGKVVNDDTFYKNVRLSLQKLDKATESLEDQGPLSVIGIAVGSLF